MTESQNTMIDLVPIPVADVKTEVIDGELLLYHPVKTRAVYLNPPAAVIWSLCDGRRPVHEIIALIAESYPESKPDLTDHVLDTLHQLYENGVLTAQPDAI